MRLLKLLFKKQNRYTDNEVSENNSSKKTKALFITYQDLNTYYAIFYDENMIRNDIDVRACLLYTPFNNGIDYLLPNKQHCSEAWAREYEYIKPTVRKFTNDFMAQNPEYKYWQIIGVYNKTLKHIQTYG